MRDATLWTSVKAAFPDRLSLPDAFGAGREENAMPTQYWRSPETIERLNRLHRPGFAVEFLRRNTDYQRDYARTQRQIFLTGTDAAEARSEFARRWGLRFRP